MAPYTQGKKGPIQALLSPVENCLHRSTDAGGIPVPGANCPSLFDPVNAG